MVVLVEGVLAGLAAEDLAAAELQEVGSMKKKGKKTDEKLLLCPRCKINMKKLIKNKVIIDVCKRCGGMWVDAGELEKLAQIAKK
jgi:protein-arginine kinase activator protein McsA